MKKRKQKKCKKVKKCKQSIHKTPTNVSIMRVERKAVAEGRGLRWAPAVLPLLWRGFPDILSAGEGWSPSFRLFRSVRALDKHLGEFGCVVERILLAGTDCRLAMTFSGNLLLQAEKDEDFLPP